ncbi:MAG TPA: glycosyl transferase [Desulfobacteria bacterium]|nr:glycosyl transferase [Desulfobacteria bacterium]
MKVLLLTDMPPCKNYTAGLVLDQLCRFLPRGSVACFAVVNPHLDVKISDDLDWIPTRYYKYYMPREKWPLKSVRWGKTASFANESLNSLFGIKKVISKAVEFGREFGATAVWCVLEGQIMIQLASPVAKQLNIPLLTQVWDPPGWWLREYKVDGVSTRRILNEFSMVQRESTGCAVASWAMAERYNHDYGTRVVPVIPSLPGEWAVTPAQALNPGDNLVIGMAGQIYATQEWTSLISALDSVGWQINGRNVIIRLLGRKADIYASGKMRVEFYGWTPQKETIKLMSEADILYCPYWFDPVFKEEASLSFPSKLTTYLAAGRPVLFHGPEYASPARFLDEHEAGVFCHSLGTDDLVSALTRLVSDKNLYSKVARNGLTAFNQYLTLDSMRKSFAEFLKVDENFLLPV